MQANKEAEEEGRMLPIREGWRSGSNPEPEHTLSRVLASARSANPYATIDTLTSRRDTSSNTPKRSYDLRGDCYVVRYTNEGKSVILPFKEGPTPRVDDPFFDKYPMPELEMDGEEILFWLDWNLK